MMNEPNTPPPMRPERHDLLLALLLVLAIGGLWAGLLAVMSLAVGLALQ